MPDSPLPDHYPHLRDNTRLWRFVVARFSPTVFSWTLFVTALATVASAAIYMCLNLNNNWFARDIYQACANQPTIYFYSPCRNYASDASLCLTISGSVALTGLLMAIVFRLSESHLLARMPWCMRNNRPVRVFLIVLLAGICFLIGSYLFFGKLHIGMPEPTLNSVYDSMSINAEFGRSGNDFARMPGGLPISDLPPG